MTKVLVVDDTPEMASLMARAVEAEGYDVFVAGDGRRALELAAAQRPDVILLDVMMPGMSGVDVLRRLKEDDELRAIPVILVTALGKEADIVAGLDAGAHDYVTKPFKRQVLAARVRAAARMKQQQDAVRQAHERLKAEMAERTRIEQELAQAQKLESIGHLAAGIAHEINTPAQYVGDNTRFLREIFDDVNSLLDVLDKLLQAAKRGHVSEDLVTEAESVVRDAEVDYLREEAPKAIEQSLEGIQRVSDIVHAMKEFSHPGAGRKEPVDLNRAIQSTLTVSRNEWKYVADMVADFDSGLPLVPCLPGDFNQVILNLVVNAAQAIGEAIEQGSAGKGVITVRTRRADPWAEIRVEDTGVGIPEEIRDKIFDHFFTTKEVGKGTGQGLAIAHSIVVQKHGGEISFESEEGKGTTFIVRLPMTEDAETAPAAETAGAAAAS